MKEDLKYLLRLQEIDNQIFNIQLSKEKIPQEIEEVSNLLVDKKAQMEHAKNTVAELEKSKRAIESEIKMEEERIKKDKERLMQVKTNEEYHALLREIDNSKREISDRETNIIKFLEEIDNAKLKIDEISASLGNLENEMNMKKEELDRFLKDVDQNITLKTKQREEFVGKIKPTLLKKYNVIKEKKGYSEVLIEVVDYSCKACNMHVPPQMVNEIRSFKEVHVCPTCERILYWKDPNEKND